MQFAACVVLVVALVASFFAPLATGQQPCSTSTTGLPTSAGTWNVLNGTYFNASAVSAWPEYAVAQSAIAYTVAPLTDQSGVSYPAGSWVWWGTQPVVSISSTQGQTWGLLNNSGSDYPNGLGNALCAHRASINRFYVLGDSVSGTQSSTSFIYASNNGELWQNIITSTVQTAWSTRNLAYTGCVVDISNTLYSLGENDIWASTSQGVTWSNITTGSFYTPRSSFGYGIFSASYGDVMVVAGGSAGIASAYGAYIQDVWVSQTGGKSWVQRTASAPWPGRTEPNLAISTSGAMVLQGGRGYTTQQVWLSDAWLSLDGGATWTLLNSNTNLNRSASASVLDQFGFLYLFSGESTGYQWNKDGWRSTYALNNVQSWSTSATQGALTVPSSFSACTPYYNVISSAPSTSSSGGAAAASSSAGAQSTAAGGVSSSAAAAPGVSSSSAAAVVGFVTSSSSSSSSSSSAGAVAPVNVTSVTSSSSSSSSAGTVVVVGVSSSTYVSPVVNSASATGAASLVLLAALLAGLSVML